MNKSDYYIQKIRKDEFEKLTGSVSNNTPFLLFPVRIETHFRKGTASSITMLNDVLEIYKTIAGIIEKLNAGNKDIIPDLARLEENIAVSDALEMSDKPHILHIVIVLENNLAAILTGEQYKKARVYIDAIKSLCTTVKTNQNNSYNKTTYFIKRLKKCLSYIHTLSRYEKLPYRSPKYFKVKEHKDDFNKKLYKYIDNVLDKSIAFLEAAPRMLNSLNSITGSQNVAIRKVLFNNNTTYDLQNINKTLSNVYENDSFQDNDIENQYGNEWDNKVQEIDAKLNILRNEYYTLKIEEKDYQEKFTGIATLLLKAIFKFKHNKNTINAWNNNIYQINQGLKHCVYTSREEYDFVKNLTNTLKQMMQNYSGYVIPKFVEKSILPYNPVSKENIPAKELCVRIFPDEIFLDYLTEGLTEQEIEDGKFFWMQWYIASGSEKREYEAWQVLCKKYEIHRAAWIARSLKPRQLDDFRTNGKLFYRRPYKGLDEVETLLEDICNTASSVTLNEADSIDRATGEWKNEKQIREAIQRIKQHLADIDAKFLSCEYIVDYLFDNVSNVLNYLKRRLNSFVSFYNKFPGKYGGNTRHMELWDIDYTSLLSFIKDVDEFSTKIANKYISLEEMIDKYLKDPKHKYFVNTSVKVNKSNTLDVPTSLILPERFIFIGEESNKKTQIVRYGRRVKQNLQLGFDPNEDTEAVPYKINENGELEVHGGMNWMVNYEEAEKAGMAITVPLEASITGFNYIYILGVKDCQEKDKEYLEELFNSHNYSTSGLELLKVGMATNLLDGMNLENKNVYDTDADLLMRKRYDIEVEDVYKKSSYKLSDANRISEMLGMSFNECWGHVSNSDNTELSKVEQVNKIIWDYFLPELTSNGAFGRDGDTSKAATKTFTENGNVERFLLGLPNFLKYYCKGSGMLPSFKIGDQPYGILPITNFLKLRSIYGMEKAFGIKPTSQDMRESKFISQLNQILILLSERWKRLRNERVISADNLNLKKVGDTQADNAQTRYLKMAGLTPYSSTFYERQMIESPLLPQNNRYYNLTHTTFAKNLASIFDWTSSNATPYSQFLDNTKLFDAIPINDLFKQISLSENDSYPCPEWLSSIKSNIKTQIKDISDKECNMLIAEFFDLFTYRIDAWYMAILNYNLYKFGKVQGAAQRQDFRLNTPKIGAFGWVFNLREKSRREISNKAAVAQQMNLSDTKSPIYQNTNTDSDEYIVAPSVQHAITAAVLRSSYRNSKTSADDTRMSVNLSSMRARQALRMIDGIKSGMSTGLVLGVDLEGYMHNAYKTKFENQYCEMSQYIYPLRKLFPQTIDIEAEDKRADNYIMQTINGEAILNTFKDKWNNVGSVYDFLNRNYKQINELKWVDELFGNNSSHRKCLFKLIERMADSYDALSDLLLSEGVYRLVQGNRSAFASIINFMAKGSGNLPEPAILNTPMEHVVSEYKVGIALPQYKQIIQRPMCIGEPSVNLWLAQLIGNMDDIYFIVKKKNGEKNIFEKFSLLQLEITPIEYLYLSSEEAQFSSYLEMQYRLINNDFTSKLTILHSAPDNFGKNDVCQYVIGDKELSLFENELRINSLRSLVRQSRRMKANDWVAQTTSDTEEENTVDINELKFRYECLLGYAKNLNQQMISLKNRLLDEYYSNDVLIEICYLLNRCVEIGMTSSLSGFKLGIFIDDINKIANRPLFDRSVEMQQSFVKSFEFVQTELEKRILDAENIILQKDPNVFSSELYINAMQKILLESFKIYPRFSIHPATSVEQRNSYNIMLKNGISHYKNLSEMRFEEWTNDVAEVREGMKTWNHIRMFESLCGKDLGKSTVIQMKSEGDTSLDEWLGCEVSDESVLDDVDSLVIYNSDTINIKQDVSYNSGLIIDSWLEYIPYKKQSAGMVFHTDQPDAEAPQTLLLAISPDFHCANQKCWSLKNLVNLIEEARFLAMNRAVEPDHIYKDFILSAILPLLSKKNS